MHLEIVWYGVSFVVLPVVVTNLLSYLFLISPQHFSGNPPNTKASHRFLGWAMYLIAYNLSILRLPFIFVPYLSKLFCFILLRRQFQQKWDDYSFQLLRTCGDFLNLFITMILFYYVLRWLTSAKFEIWLVLSMIAEIIRLVSEKGQMLFSAIWQLIPHRNIAQILNSHSNSLSSRPTWFTRRYIDYYALSDDARIEVILNTLKNMAGTDQDAAQKLGYVQNLRIVPRDMNLRVGNVRNVAAGEIFIHAQWTNDPWLLAGQVLRRTPWIFDPRYIRRPFYYRTESNRLATLFVLQHAHYSPPYAWYQFGHEIKVARYDLFYRICRWIGKNIEEPVGEDGIYNFDPFIRWLQKRLNYGYVVSCQTPLWSDEKVIAEILATLPWREIPSPSEIATQYAYPLKYVLEVLHPLIVSKATKTEQNFLEIYPL